MVAPSTPSAAASGVELGDGNRARHADRRALLPQQHGGAVDTVGGGDDEEGGICGPQTRSQLPDEVRIAGGVNEVEHHALMGDAGDTELHGALIEDRLGPVARGGGGEQMLEQGRLAGSAVPHEHHIADLTGGSGLQDRCARGSLGAHGETMSPHGVRHNPARRVGTLGPPC